MKKLFFIGFCIVNGYSVLAQKISPVDVILTRVDSLRDKARYSEAIIAADSAVRLAKKNR